MKLTLIRTARETGKETFSTWPSDTLMEKMKTENKAGHISALRSLIPHITGSNGHYPCIDKLPRICPAAEYARSKEGERYLKTYNGLVQIEVNHLANAVEVEQVKRQAALLPQTFAAFCGSSGRSVKIWVLFATPDGSRPRQEEKIRLFHTAAYRLADQRVRSSIGQNALKEGISVWDRDVARYLNSDAIPLYNPIEEYLNSTGHWDGKDRIRALADLVPCNNPYWRELFYRWFLSMTAHWQNIDRQHGNNTSPLLVGAQGYRKSTLFDFSKLYLA